MIHFLVFIFIGSTALFQTSRADEGNLIVEGKIISQAFIPDVYPTSCIEDARSLCMNNYYRYTIRVEESLSTKSPKIIKAALFQHGGRYYRGSDNYIFVLEPIKKDKAKRLLESDYYLKEWVFPKSEYCFDQSLSSYYKNVDDLKVLSKNCFSTVETLITIKYNLLYEFQEKIADDLSGKELLIEYADLWLHKNGTLYSNISDFPESCSVDEDKEYDLDYQDKCDSSWMQNTAVVEYKVKKGHSSEVVSLIEKFISSTSIDLPSPEILVETEEDSDRVRWTYTLE